MRVYLDTSTLLRVVFGQAGQLRDWSNWDEAYTSALTRVEAHRAIERLRLSRTVNDAELATYQSAVAVFEASVTTMGLSRRVLRRAGLPMGTPVKTLDAIHLASALLLQESHVSDLSFGTHDKRQAQAATALGLPVVGV